MSNSVKLPDKKVIEEEFRSKMNKLLEQAIGKIDLAKKELLESLKKDLEIERNNLIKIIEES